MPRVNQLVTVAITETGNQNGKRSWSATIEATASLFLLSDELAREGAIKEFESSLRSVIRDAVADYVASGREFIKGIAKQGKEKSEAA